MMSPVQGTTHTADQLIKDTTTKVLARLATAKQSLEADPTRLHVLIDELVAPHFDFFGMSRWILGKAHWRSASKSEQEEFVIQFRTLLINTYAKLLFRYANEEVEYLAAENKPNAKLVVVKTKISRPGEQAIPVDYRMHATKGEWKVVDVVVDGVSLVSTYRGSFRSEISNNGFASLISKLAERNAAKTEPAD